MSTDVEVEQVGIYLRISSDPTGSELGVQRQLEDCQSWCEQGWTWEVYKDNDTSAFSGKRRPEFERMLKDAESGRIQAIVAWKLDRLVRRMTDLIRLVEVCRQRKTRLIFDRQTVTPGSPIGDFHLYILAAVAELSVAIQRDRQLAESAQRASRGLSSGGGRRPFGYSVVGDPEGFTQRDLVVPQEAELIQEAYRRLKAGDSLRGIATDWNARGIKTTAAGKKHKDRVVSGNWDGTNLRLMLSAPRLYGYRQHNGELYPAQWDPILTEVEWHEIQFILGKRSAQSSEQEGAQRPRSFLLVSGLTVCGACGAAMQAHSVTNGGGKRIPMYGCIRDSGGCNKVFASREPVEAFVTEQALSHLWHWMEAVRSGQPYAQVASVTGQEAVTELLALQQRLQDLADEKDDGLIQREEYLRRRARLEERMALIRSERTESVHENIALQLLHDCQTEEDLAQVWQAASFDRKHEILRSAIERIEIMPAGRGGNRFKTERVQIKWWEWLR